MKDNLILRLNSDKLKLEQEVIGLKEHLSEKAEKQVKSGKQSAEHKERTSWQQNSVQKSQRIYKCDFYYTQFFMCHSRTSDAQLWESI